MFRLHTSTNYLVEYQLPLAVTNMDQGCTNMASLSKQMIQKYVQHQIDSVNLVCFLMAANRIDGGKSVRSNQFNEFQFPDNGCPMSGQPSCVSELNPHPDTQ